MIKWPNLPEDIRVKRLAPPSVRPVPVVMDTDTYNEIDDQFAVAYAQLSPQIDLRAVYAAPFFNGRSTGAADGMEKSYQELLRLLKLMDKSPEGFAFRGSDRFMAFYEDAVDSPAVRDLIAKAMAMPEDQPLYVLTIGCPVNVSSALLIEPKLVEKIVVVWLGGNATQGWPEAREFNLMQDLYASQILFDSGVPLVLLPCMPVVSQLATTLPELEHYLGDSSPLGQYLYRNVAEYAPEKPEDRFCWSKVIWDPVTVAWCLQPRATPQKLVPAPYLEPSMRYSFDARRHLMAEVTFVDRDAIFRELFGLLGAQR